MKRALFFFLISYRFLWSNLATTENHPSSLVEGCISAITGDAYVAEEDMVIAGAEPIHLRRYYISAQGMGTWRYFNHLVVLREGDHFRVTESNGTSLVYVYDKKTDRYLPDLKKSQKGLTNTARGKISGLTNLKNQYLTKNHKGLFVHAPDGSERLYTRHSKRTYILDIGSGDIRYDSCLLLQYEQLPNENYIFYDWFEDGRPKKIYSTDAKKKTIFAWAKIEYDHEIRITSETDVRGIEIRGTDFEIKTSDGRRLTFEHEKYIHELNHEPYRKKDYWQLSAIKSRYLPEEKFSYKVTPHKSLLTSIYLDQGRSLNFNYYKTGHNSVALGWRLGNYGK